MCEMEEDDDMAVYGWPV